MNMYKKINKCLCCGSKKISQFLNLGSQPLANNLAENYQQDTEEFPLCVNYCNSCWHSQLSISVNPEILFKDYYYVTGTSKTMQNYCEVLSRDIYKRTGHISTKNKKILDIASNDGTFLSKFSKYNWILHGVDPAENLSKLCKEKGVRTHVNFFGSDEIDFGTKFDVITALNVFAHVPNPLDFLLECKKHMTETGIIVIQTSQRDMVIKRQFDTVYHEHISFFSVKSMVAICKRAGLFLNDISLPEIHGGSYVFYISKSNKVGQSVKDRIGFEEQENLYNKKTYQKYQEDISSLSCVIKSKLKHKSLVGFGAAAKGIVALHSLGLNPDFIIDENPLKIGKILPKKNIPIVDISKLSEIEDDLDIIILPWNFKNEISEKIKDIRRNRDNLICIF